MPCRVGNGSAAPHIETLPLISSEYTENLIQLYWALVGRPELAYPGGCNKKGGSGHVWPLPPDR
jgi:hypothetical protein